MAYQSFQDISDPAQTAGRVAQLRSLLRKLKLTGFVVPRSDAYLGEYVPPSAERLSWITGFTGSAGSALIMARKAAFFTDGRYTLQAEKQVDGDIFHIAPAIETPSGWLRSTLTPKDRLGFDPRLHTPAQTARLSAACAEAKAKLIPVELNPVDTIWTDRPAEPNGPIRRHPLKYAGEKAQTKIEQVAKTLKAAGQDAVILTLPESIAWLFNIRGRDLPHTPVALCFAIIKARGKPEIFADPSRLDRKTGEYLRNLARVSRPGKLEERLKKLGAAKAKIRLDKDSAAYWFDRTLTRAGAKIVAAPDPCMALKARKNKVEINGARRAHLRDGTALCRFLAWLDREAPQSRLDEITAARKFEQLRALAPEFRDLSFPAISAVGANSAIVHYRVTEASNTRFKKGTLYLSDSGGQYPDGTTDVTRTIAIGTPSAEMRRHFTLVLKGHIALAQARFAAGTTGAHLDILARGPLWHAGLDFDHGTGHGVGSYLSVHEGPARISKLGFNTALEPGMILSNEPGYYRAGKYGIRIENLILVTAPEKTGGGDRPMLGFETLTLAPIDARLIDTELLEDSEKNWLNQYHKRVFEEIGPHLQGADKTWLKQATRVF